MIEEIRMKNAIVIGATSGIGRELAILLSQNGYLVCVTGRRLHLLEELQAELPARSLYRHMDVSDPPAAIETFASVASELGGIDLVIISAGTGFIDPEFQWQKEKETIDTNVSGCVAIANTAYHHFVQRGSGHLVGISSLAAIRGGPAPAYNASKAFLSSYLEGLRFKIAKLGVPIDITDIRPGFVDTEMAKGEGLFWVQPPEKAALQIFAAIRKRKKTAYITKRWKLVAWILRILPDAIYHRM